MNAHDHPLPDEWRDEWSRELARPIDKSAASDAVAMLVFRLGSEWFSLPAACAVEISHLRSIHRVPHRSHGIGVVNVRGRVTACVNLALLLQPLGDPGTVEGRLVVFKHGDWMFATRMDAVDGVHRLKSSALGPPPPPAGANRFVTGLWALAGRSIAFVDQKLLFNAAREVLA